MFFTRLLRKSGRKSARQNRQEFGLNQRIKSIYIRRIHFAELLFSVQTKRLNPIHINKVKRDPAKAEPHFQEKETLKTRRRFENSHVRVAQQQFRTAYRIDRSSANLFRRTITPCTN